MDTPAPWELNIWYHTLNCGYRARISGETDFPCIYGERVGLGRVYVKLADGQLDFDRWCEGIKDGRSYVSDGRATWSTSAWTTVGVGEVGQRAEADRAATVKVTRPGRGLARAEPSAEREGDPPASARSEALLGHRARPDRREPESPRRGHRQRLCPSPEPRSPPTARSRTSLSTCQIKQSSWVALRIYPSSHTNPVFVLVGGKPIRASQEIGRVVPEERRSVLVAEGACHPRVREGGGQEGLRPGTAGVSEDSRGIGGELRRSQTSRAVFQPELFHSIGPTDAKLASLLTKA